METKTLERCELAVADNGDVVFWAVAVDKNRRPNRKGWVFDWQKPSDVDVRNLKRNPVLLYLHDNDLLPVGRIEEIVVTDRQVKMRCRIPGGPGYEGLETLRRWVTDGYLRAVSIGFYINKAEEMDIPGSEAKAVRIRSFEIVELSLCPIGAHETALIQDVGLAGAEVGALPEGATWEEETNSDRVLYRLALDTTYTCECISCGYRMETDKHCRDVKCPKCGGEMRRAERPGPGQQAERWKAIPYSRHGKCPKAPEANNPDVKGGYKLPHHKPGGKKPTVVWRGVAAAMAVLFGARGGVKGVSDAEKRKGYNHLAEHYADFDKEPPEYQDYSTEDLERLHDEGRIIIPGRETEERVLPIVADDAELSAVRTTRRRRRLPARTGRPCWYPPSSSRPSARPCVSRFKTPRRSARIWSGRPRRWSTP